MKLLRAIMLCFTGLLKTSEPTVGCGKCKCVTPPHCIVSVSEPFATMVDGPLMLS